jgi:hypothetical protein
LKPLRRGNRPDARVRHTISRKLLDLIERVKFGRKRKALGLPTRRGHHAGAIAEAE